jgi:hypothetical protein
MRSVLMLSVILMAAGAFAAERVVLFEEFSQTG